MFKDTEDGKTYYDIRAEMKAKFKDMVGKRPPIHTKNDAFELIKRICNDERHHLLASDEIEWLEFKLNEIKKIVKKGMICLE